MVIPRGWHKASPYNFSHFHCEVSYQVNLTPVEISLLGSGLFEPDLALTDDLGATLFIEAERCANKNIEQRQSKWRNFHQVSGGRLYVVCDILSGMCTIRSEITYCLGSQPTTLSLTNLADFQAGKRGPGDSIWLEVKHIKGLNE